jgi:hypothetical protein
MRDRQRGRRTKASKNRSGPAVPLGTVRDEQHAVVAEDTGAISASPEANKFAQGNTAGGRHPAYKPEYAERAKAMCDRGATLDELAEVFEVPPKTIRFWTISNGDFFEACKVTPGCVERAKRNIFDIAMGQKVVTERIVQSGSKKQTTKVTNHLPANLAASKSFVPDEVVPLEGELRQLLKELQGSRTGVTYRGPDGTMMSKEEHLAVGGVPDSEIDWRNKSADEITQCKQILFERRRQKS